VRLPSWRRAGCAAAGQSGQSRWSDQAKEELNRGIGAFRNAEYAKTVEGFRSAVESEADCTQARLYPATAYMQKIHSRSRCPGKPRYGGRGEGAVRQGSRTGASLYLNRKKPDEATTWYKKLISVKPDAKEVFYTLGVIAWAAATSRSRKPGRS
jgi:hypothetical protein